MTPRQQQARDRAVHLLQHYIQVVGIKAGMKWERDLDVEIESIVDDIILAATPPAPGETGHALAVAGGHVDGPDPRD